MSETNNINVTFDLQKMFAAYDKEEFMKKVFVEFLKSNPEIIAKALGNYIIADLVKSGSIQEISAKVKDGVESYLKVLSENQPYANPLKTDVNNLISESAKAHKPLIDQKVKEAINDSVTRGNVVAHVTRIVEGRITGVLGELSECECQR